MAKEYKKVKVNSSVMDQVDLYKRARALHRDTEDGKLRPYTNWEEYQPAFTQDVDIITDPDSYIDEERLKSYQGIYARMNQGIVGDQYAHIQGPLWGQDLYSY